MTIYSGSSVIHMLCLQVHVNYCHSFASAQDDGLNMILLGPLITVKDSKLSAKCEFNSKSLPTILLK